MPRSFFSLGMLGKNLNRNKSLFLSGKRRGKGERGSSFSASLTRDIYLSIPFFFCWGDTFGGVW